MDVSIANPSSLRDVANVDRAVALSRVGGDAQLLQEIAQLFLDDYPQALIALRDALAIEDARGVERNAHSLKGSVSNFGAADAVAAALELEILGRAGRVAEARSALPRLEAALAALKPELEAL